MPAPCAACVAGCPQTEAGLTANQTGPDEEAPKANLTFRRKLAYSVAFAVIVLLATESVARVAFFVGDGFSRYYLTYGFVPDINRMSAQYDGYMKFQPLSTYRFRSGHSGEFAMSINADGFRGPADFVRPKPAGQLRIVTLGESSTFGLTSHDDETYAASLERRLRARLPGRDVAVYNLGIPLYRLDNILAVAREEVPSLEPDIVTLYSGYNNAMTKRSRVEVGVLFRAKDWLKSHSVAYSAVHPYAVTAYLKLARALQRDPAGVPTLALPIDLSTAKVAEARAGALAEYGSDLDSLVAQVRRIGATLVIVTQSYSLAKLSGHRLPGPQRTYGEELALVDSMLQVDGSVPAPYATLLIHHDLTERLRATARAEGLPLIDGISALDVDRDRMMSSYVHLTKEGNERLADIIERGIVEAGLVRGPEGASTQGASVRDSTRIPPPPLRAAP